MCGNRNQSCDGQTLLFSLSSHPFLFLSSRLSAEVWVPIEGRSFLYTRLFKTSRKTQTLSLVGFPHCLCFETARRIEWMSDGLPIVSMSHIFFWGHFLSLTPLSLSSPFFPIQKYISSAATNCVDKWELLSTTHNCRCNFLFLFFLLLSAQKQLDRKNSSNTELPPPFQKKKEREEGRRWTAVVIPPTTPSLSSRWWC